MLFQINGYYCNNSKSKSYIYFNNSPCNDRSSKPLTTKMASALTLPVKQENYKRKTLNHPLSEAKNKIESHSYNKTTRNKNISRSIHNMRDSKIMNKNINDKTYIPLNNIDVNDFNNPQQSKILDSCAKELKDSICEDSCSKSDYKNIYSFIQSNSEGQREMSCRCTLRNCNDLSVEDKLIQIKNTFSKFCKQNQKIQSSKSLPKINENLVSSNLISFSVGYGKIDTIFRMKQRALKRNIFKMIKSN